MTRCDLALRLLRDAGPGGVTTDEFMRAGVGSRYGARLKELRDQGHQIDAERQRESQWRYTLTYDAGGSERAVSHPTSAPGDDAASPASVDGSLSLFDTTALAPRPANAYEEAA